jgi:hypothetical protein
LPVFPREKGKGIGILEIHPYLTKWNFYNLKNFKRVAPWKINLSSLVDERVFIFMGISDIPVSSKAALKQ